ncbi:MAG: NADH-quinone oxidoreductase subunit NuoF [Phycisphaerales bacterium]
MDDQTERTVRAECEAHGNDPGRLVDIVRGVQQRLGHVGDEAIDAIARRTGARPVDVAAVVEFYAFFSRSRKGKVVIRLCDDIIDRMMGYEQVRQAVEAELGIAMGQTTEDGLITLERTACIGMCDQAPAALINDIPVTHLSTDKARRFVRELRSHGDPKRLVRRVGDGMNAHPLVHAMVENNVRLEGPVIFSPERRGEAIAKALAMSPAEVIRAIKTARLRGRGGAGFPTGIKWELARAAPGERKVVFCNADEGEPGTFKDRVILTERPDRVFAGMTIAGYAVGAREGIVYLRGEYAYLLAYLEDVLERRRRDGLLGCGILGRRGFDFDIRIQLGAGAYICGEETALLSSCEGRPGEPKTRPPFPVQRGYMGCPSVVNNVETLACVTKILEEGPASFCALGTSASSGTKLLSISGDCMRPGVYEVPMGVPLSDVLDLCGADEPKAVQVGGPSGRMVDPVKDGGRRICYDDLATGGAIMVFGPERDLLEVVAAFMEFFVDESCGYCTPCRVGNVLLKERIEIIRKGRGEPGDLKYLQELGEMIRATSRCGLGQSSPNPILTTLSGFRPVYESLVRPAEVGLQRAFDLRESVRASERIAGRASVYVKEAPDE